MFGIGILVAMVTFLGGCTFCLRYFTSMVTASDTSDPLQQAKKAGLRKKMTADDPEGNHDNPIVPPTLQDNQMTIIKIEGNDFERSAKRGHYLTSDDLRRFSLTPQVGDWRYYSDCNSCSSLSDATLSPGGSPFVSPPGTPTGSVRGLVRLNSAGSATSYQPSIGKISEGNTLAVPDERRHSAQIPGYHSKHGGGKRRKHYGTLQRSLSVPVLPVCHLNPEIEFEIRYDVRTCSLIIESVKASDLNLSSLCCGNIFAKLDLLPNDSTRYTEKQVSCPSPVFSGVIVYDNLKESDLHKLSLLVTLYYDPVNSRKETPIGEALIKVSELEVSGENKEVKRALKKRRLRKVTFYFFVRGVKHEFRP